MKGFGADAYDRVASFYDDWFGVPLGPPETVSFLADLAGEGPVLELGIGTGRVAIPLKEKGLEVHGIDASEGILSSCGRRRPSWRSL